MKIICLRGSGNLMHGVGATTTVQAWNCLDGEGNTSVQNIGNIVPVDMA